MFNKNIIVEGGNKLIDFDIFSNRIAIVDGNASITYGILGDKIKEIQKIVKSEYRIKVAIWLDNSIDYITAYFANIRANNIIIPIYSAATINEVLKEIGDLKIDLLITDSKKFRGNVKEQNLCSIFFMDTLNFLIKKVIKEDVLMDKDLEDVFLLLNTSGTTSKSKKVMHSIKNIKKNALYNIQNLGLTSSDTCLICLPLNFGYANTSQMITHLLLGGKVVLFNKVFSPNEFLNEVREREISITTLVPAQLFILSQLKEVYPNIFLKKICFGAGFIDMEIIRRLKKIFPNTEFIHTYGFTEAGPRITSYTMKENDLYKKELPVGKTISDEIKISIKPFEGSDYGEILVHSPTIMKGYYPQINRSENYWFHSGDIGYFDKNRDLVIKGRKKNIFKISGFTIFPEEIEQIILKVKDVRACRVSTVKNNLGFEVLKAEYEGTIEEKELRNECINLISKYKIPYIFEKKDCIARTYNGKIKR